ncbi:hypothetical protein [Pygmaiobacter massiliensis]|uniref:hypothetical protein n=1 Tax=Pygmaiobacter massiliensis TaxID=1917873 RepID=UPI000C7A7E06|nr:hypothetical protein [Pygmaiobacter massiliensis]
MIDIFFSILGNLVWVTLVYAYKCWQKVEKTKKYYILIKSLFFINMSVGILSAIFAVESNGLIFVLRAVSAFGCFGTSAFMFFNFVTLTQRFEQAAKKNSSTTK